MVNFNSLISCSEIDLEKRKILEKDLGHEILSEKSLKKIYHDHSVEFNDYTEDYILFDECCEIRPVSPGLKTNCKICPECGKKYDLSESICTDCYVRLKSYDAFDIEINPEFEITKSNTIDSFNQLLTDDNLDKIADFNFNITDYNNIIRNIKKTAYDRLNQIIKSNNIDLYDFTIVETVELFCKTFVNLEYKSHGHNLGYYEFNTIYIDDRQLNSLRITTILHELTHFLLKEILTHVLCELLDISKNSYAEAFITFALSSSSLSMLVDEYAAHTVEGRFTLFGYQDYSSFLTIEHELSDDEVSVCKMIGNSFANSVKDILEGFLDDELRSDIKEQFLKDNHDDPDYNQLIHESCRKLTDDGFCQAIQLILMQAFENADLELLDNYEKNF